MNNEIYIKMNEILVVFYSRYFDKSIEIKEYLENNLDNVRTLNVDNKDVRDRILRDETYSIRYVPTILILKEDGSIEIFEKEAAINYYNSIKKKNEIKTETEENRKQYFMKKMDSSDNQNREEATELLKELPKETPQEATEMNTKNLSVMELAKAMENGRA